VLACPVWQETRDVMMTPHGRCKSLQGGASLSEIADSVLACVMCGSCEAVCPEQIDTIGLARRLRVGLTEAGLSPLARRAAGRTRTDTATATVTARRVFLAGRLAERPDLLAAVTDHLMRHGGVVPGPETVTASRRWEAGLPDAARLLDRALARMPRAASYVTADGATHRWLRERAPGASVAGLGETLLRVEPLRQALSPEDFYVLEPLAYHVDHARLAPFYERLRQETGCQLNLDLQRLAISTGRGLQDELGISNLDWRAQIRWMLQGRTLSRVIVEDLGDVAPFAEVTGLPVLHVAELLS
jgi:ferredoxin